MEHTPGGGRGGGEGPPRGGEGAARAAAQAGPAAVAREPGGAGRGASAALVSKPGNFCNFLAGSFSAVSKRNFARQYAFDSIFHVLQDVHTSASL